MYVCGGKDEDNLRLDDTWLFDFETLCWTKVSSNQIEDGFLSRSGHASGTFKNQFMFVFGGIHEVTKELDDLWIFNPDSNRWH